jgi:hypothetical protein
MKKIFLILSIPVVAAGLWWLLSSTDGKIVLHRVGVSIEGNPSTIDPPSVMDVHSSQVATAVHAPLAWVAPDGSLVPMVAQRMEMSADAMRLDIELAPNITFWDGSSVGVVDVIYTLERYRRSPNLHRWILDRVQGVEEFDEKVAEHISGFKTDAPGKMSVEFSQPEPDAALMLCNLSVAIVKQGTGELPEKPFGAHVVGCGPYAPGEFKPSLFQCVRRGSQVEGPAELVFEVIQDDQARLNSFRRGETKILRLRGPMISEATVIEGGQLRARPSVMRGNVGVFPANELTYAIVNWSSPKLSSISSEHRPGMVRALSSLLPRAQLAADILPMNCAEPTASIAPPITGAIATTAMSMPPPRTPPIPQSLTLLAANDSASRQLAMAMQRQLAIGGIRIEIEFVDLGKLIERLIEKQFDLMAFWIELQVASSGPYAWCSFFDKAAPLSAFGEARDDTGDLLTEARGIGEPSARAAAFRKVVSLIDERQHSWVPMMSRKAVVLHTASLHPWFDINGTPINGLIQQEKQ